MSQIEDLIREHCPKGVPFCALGDLVRIASARIDASTLDATTYVGVDNLLANFAGRKDSAYGAPSGGAIRFGVDDILIGNIRPYLKKVWLADRDGGASPDVLTLTPLPEATNALLPRFLYYLIASDSFIRYSMQHAKGAKMPRGDKVAILKYRVPVPPLEVQRKIVEVLDAFSGLAAELDAELEARSAQRAALATNFSVMARDQEQADGAVERVSLGSLARESVDPVRVAADESYVSLGVKWNGEGVLVREPRSGREIKAATLYRAHPGQLVYNRMFVVEGSFAIIPPECAGSVVSGEFPLFDLDTSRVEPGWLLHYLCDPFTLARIEQEVTGTERGTMKSRRRWKQAQFAAFEIELPSLERQREVMNVLRSCDALISSLEEEVDCRRQQYSYYRDRLLSLEEVTA